MTDVTDNLYVGFFETDRPSEVEVNLPAEARRYAYDSDGTIIQWSGGQKISAGQNHIFTAEQLSYMNSEGSEAVGASVQWDDQTNVNHTPFSLDIIFPEEREVYAIVAIFGMNDENNIDEFPFEVNDVAYTHVGYVDGWDEDDDIYHPYVATDDSAYLDELTGVWVFPNPTIIDQDRIYKPRGNGARGFHGKIETYDNPRLHRTQLQEIHPAYLVQLAEMGSHGFTAGRFFRFGGGASFYAGAMRIEALHIYGRPVAQEEKTIAFTNSLGEELVHDISFGSIPRGSGEYTAKFHLKNLMPFSEVRGISVSLDDPDLRSLSEVLFSIEEGIWVDVLEVGFLEAGEISDEITMRFKPSADLPLGLITSRIRVDIGEVY